MHDEDVANLEILENGHWWGDSRTELLLKLCSENIPPGGSILEIGSGTGEMANQLQERGFNVTALEPSSMSDQIKSKFNNLKVEKMTFDHFVSVNSSAKYSAIVLFDVLEHIENDINALRNIHSILELGGILILSVPADASLWSKLDEQVFHFRRYDKRMLEVTLKYLKYEVIQSRYWMSLLKPAVKFYRKIKNPDLQGNTKKPGLILNNTLKLLLKVEKFKITSSLPGVSIFIVAKKSNGVPN
jgi:2-polyprenyl-3-methyl-5-hydroxy-6-metoxy-1,4-benzoquinol methylase